MSLEDLTKAIEAARKRKGLSERRACLNAGLKVDAIRTMRDGFAPKIDKLTALAAVLDLTVAEMIDILNLPANNLVGPDARGGSIAAAVHPTVWMPSQRQANDAAPLDLLKVIGAVQAGAYSEALEWPPDDWYDSPVAARPEYSRYKQIGLLVRGESMNEIYPPGSVVVVVSYIDLDRNPVHGERVVVQQQRGDQFEATIKEIRQHPDGSWWLWPRSTSLAFQDPWQLIDEGGEWNENLRVVAKVVGSYRPEP